MLKGNIINCGDKIIYISFFFDFIYVFKFLIFFLIIVFKYIR